MTNFTLKQNDMHLWSKCEGIDEVKKKKAGCENISQKLTHRRGKDGKGEKLRKISTEVHIDAVMMPYNC